MTFEHGIGSDEVVVLDDRDRDEERAQLTRARRWCAELFDAGYAWIDGPKRFGGAELDIAHVGLFKSIECEYDVPQIDLLIPSRRIVAPGLANAAPPELADRYVPALLRADQVACQLFSEPGAGSDLASIATRAVPDGGRWRVHGQKVWSSGAHFSDSGMLIARTSSDGPRHAGLTAFMIDMHQPAITIRPIEQMCGGANFNEVFLDDAIVEDTARIGPVGSGWKIAMATLAGERRSVAASDDNPTMTVVQQMLALAREHLPEQPASRASVLRDRAVRAYALARSAELLTARIDEESRHLDHTPARASMGKLCRSEVLRQATSVAADILGMSAVTDTGAWGTYAWGRATLQVPGVPIGGGTDEIQRNIVAERVLGLPRDPRPPAR
jgi:acyl-CoA dehydrogenase